MTEAKRVETGFAEVSGAPLYYEAAGEGHPLVLIHEGIADHRMYDDQVAAFAQHYRVIRYDVHGCGDVPNILAQADLLEQSIAGAQKVVIPSVAHVPNMERPQEFNHIVLDFLSEQ